MVNESWVDVLDQLGIAADANDPLLAESRQHFDARHNTLFPSEFRTNLARWQDAQHAQIRPLAPAPRSTVDKARKQKNKRKAASATRKANKSRRK